MRRAAAASTVLLSSSTQCVVCKGKERPVPKVERIRDFSHKDYCTMRKCAGEPVGTSTGIDDSCRGDAGKCRREARKPRSCVRKRKDEAGDEHEYAEATHEGGCFSRRLQITLCNCYGKDSSNEEFPKTQMGKIVGH